MQVFGRLTWDSDSEMQTRSILYGSISIGRMSETRARRSCEEPGRMQLAKNGSGPRSDTKPFWLAARACAADISLLQTVTDSC